jgi:hypothetical protein
MLGSATLNAVKSMAMTSVASAMAASASSVDRLSHSDCRSAAPPAPPVAWPPPVGTGPP